MRKTNIFDPRNAWASSGQLSRVLGAEKLDFIEIGLAGLEPELAPHPQLFRPSPDEKFQSGFATLKNRKINYGKWKK